MVISGRRSKLLFTDFVIRPSLVSALKSISACEDFVWSTDSAFDSLKESLSCRELAGTKT